MRRPRASPRVDDVEKQEAEKASVSGSSQAGEEGEERGMWISRQARKVPAWAFLPIVSVVVLAITLCCMMPVYFISTSASEEQSVTQFYPPEYTIVEGQLVHLETGAVFNGYVIELDLTEINPNARSLTMLYGLYQSGTYETESGVIEVGHHELVVNVGHQGFTYVTGDAPTEEEVDMFLVEKTPLYHYPFDSYACVIDLHIQKVNITDLDNLTYEYVPTVVTIVTAKQGWHDVTTLSAYVDHKNKVHEGANIDMSMARSDSVRFFSMFIVILMWAISLGMLVVALNYAMATGEEDNFGFDIPALSVVLLFALPFVREVQPDVPTVGITIDIMGFFFNMILIAIATVLVMVTLSTAFHRAQRSKAQRSNEMMNEVRCAVKQEMQSAQLREQGRNDGRDGGDSGDKGNQVTGTLMSFGDDGARESGGGELGGVLRQIHQQGQVDHSPAPP